jgi:hypothetical protein
MSRGKSLDGGPRRSRVWLGPPPRGGERLSRVFGIGSPNRQDIIESKLEELQAELRRLDEQVCELRERTPAPDVIAPAPKSPHQPLRQLVELHRLPLASDRNYWLAHCDGFTVYTGNNPLGAVDGIRFQSRIDRPDLLEVRCGRFGRQVLLVPVEQVEFVYPEEKAVVVQISNRPSGVGQRLRSRLNQLWSPLHVGG